MHPRWMTKLCKPRLGGVLALAFALLLALPAAAFNLHADAARQEIAISALPLQAQETLRLIKRGGPFPYLRDGVVFGNYEKQLPKKQRAYYREYTVKTPGVRSRGARRIVCGQASECYYSDDHYQTFKLIRE